MPQLKLRPNWGADSIPLDPEDRQWLDDFFSIVYEELRRLAYSIRSSDPRAITSPTALVHEAWMKMAGSRSFPFASELHFKRIAARAMRQLLIDAARRRFAQKRDGSLETELPIDFGELFSEHGMNERALLSLNDALDELKDMNPRQALTIEYRFFGGFDVPETAALLEVSEETVKRDWRIAKAWLTQQLRAE